MNITELQKEVFKLITEKGFNDRVIPIPEQVALIHSEASEALEAWRNNEPVTWTDDKGKPQGVASEYADIVIRACHYAELLGIDLSEEIKRKMEYNRTRPYKHGNKVG